DGGESRTDIAEQDGVGRAGRGTDSARHHHGLQLCGKDIVAEHGNPFLVLANGDEYAAAWRAYDGEAERKGGGKQSQRSEITGRGICKVERMAGERQAARGARQREALVSTGI